MLGDLSGRTALVTGAASGGMGAVISAVLARQGANVAVTDIQVGRTAEVAESLVGGEGIPLALDVSSYESAQGAVAAVEKKWGQLDILVNNAGVGPPRHDDDTFRDDEWDIPFEVNLKGAARCAAAAMPGMKRRRYGKIVNIASIAGHAARGAAGGYGVSKRGTESRRQAAWRRYASWQNSKASTSTPCTRARPWRSSWSTSSEICFPVAARWCSSTQAGCPLSSTTRTN